MEVGTGAGDDKGLEVSRIIGGPPPVFPPKLSTGLPLGTGLAESNEINEEAWSGERVVVVGGRVSEG